MTERKPIQVPQDFALCEDGTIWKWVPVFSDRFSYTAIPAHWVKVPSIPSDKEYEKQKKEREELWEKINDESQKRMRASLYNMNNRVIK